MTALTSRFKAGPLGLHYALSLFIAAAFLWLTLSLGERANPMWAVAAAAAVIDPQVKMACFPFRARIVNLLIGCAVGLAFLLLGYSREWTIPFALASAGFVSSSLVRVQLSWRIAPIIAAIVMAAGLGDPEAAGIAGDVHRVLEIVLGGLVGLVVPWLISKLWMPPESGSSIEEASTCVTGD